MKSYEAAMSQLNAAQKQAVQAIEGPVLVIAGPGTGKTQLLTTRIAHILATTDARPQNILCLTFTDSGAQAMRDRLSGLIGQDAYDVTISTYHALGADILRRFPEYFTDEAGLQPVDELGIDQIVRHIVADLPFSNPLKYSEAYLGDIKTFISDAKRALLAPKDVRTVAAQNLSFIEHANPIVQQTLQNLVRVDKKTIGLLEALESKIKQQESKPEEDSLAQLFLQSLNQALEDAKTSGKTTALTAWKNTWLAKNAAGHFVVDGTKTNQKLLAAADVYEAYLTELQARSLFDYDDMILRAVYTLQTNRDLRLTLQEQYHYLLLDEFQDTNQAQLRLVELLTDNPVHEGRPNVLAVGDDDQAIYAFQGASYSHMLQFTTLYRDVLVVPLTENYRSQPDILHLASGVVEQIGERLQQHFPAIIKTLTPAGQSGKATVERREAQSDVMQYAWVAARIQQLIKAGTPAHEIAVLAPKHKHLEPLVPFLIDQHIPVRYEKRENILADPGITQLLRMSELVLALQTGESARANALWAQVLSFDFWNIPTSRIWQLSWQATDDDRTWTDELLADPMLEPIALFFIRLSQLADSENLETMLDYLIGSVALNLHEPGFDEFTSPYYTHYFGKIESRVTSHESRTGNPAFDASFWGLLSNLIVLRARLREYQPAQEMRHLLSDFVSFVDAHQAAELQILNTSPYSSGTEAVQIMTAYKAKGLEFTAVFLLAVDDETWGSKARSQTMRIGLPPNLRHIRYAGATPDERLRLLFVALTRAKSRLYLVNYAQNYAGKTMTRLKYLNETTDKHGIVHSPLLPAGQQVVLPAEGDAPEPSTELAAYWQRRHEAALNHADLRTLLLDRLQFFQLSPTHLCDFMDVAHCGPQTFLLRTLLRFPQAPSPQVQYGNAVHETLESLHHRLKQTGAVPSTNAVHRLFAQHLASKKLSARDHQQFLERGKHALQVYLAARGPQLAGHDFVTEYNFRNEGVFAGPAHLSGKIDKLIINKQTKEITIVDYKTGRSHSKWSKEISLHKYRWQLYLYKMLVEGSHTFAGYRVVGAYLDFVEPDEVGTVQQLHLDFNAAEEQRIKQLAERVWQRITSLDLPDATSYTKDLNGIVAFENDLLTN